MSKRYRGKLNKAVTSREYKIILIDMLYPDYWDDGLNFLPRNRRGFKNSGKQLLRYQMREYKSWKHNRRTQYK